MVDVSELSTDFSSCFLSGWWGFDFSAFSGFYICSRTLCVSVQPSFPHIWLFLHDFQSLLPKHRKQSSCFFANSHRGFIYSSLMGLYWNILWLSWQTAHFLLFFFFFFVTFIWTKQYSIASIFLMKYTEFLKSIDCLRWYHLKFCFLNNECSKCFWIFISSLLVNPTFVFC